MLDHFYSFQKLASQPGRVQRAAGFKPGTGGGTNGGL